jgi:hypothetical protein
MHVLTNIPIELTLDAVLNRIHMDPGDEDVKTVTQLVDWARSVMSPKAVYDIAFVGEKTADTVEINGVTFSSRVLTVNLEPVHRVFPFIVTCGAELEHAPTITSDPMEWFWADEIKHEVLGRAYQHMQEHLTQTYEPGTLSPMSPGSLQDWPISQQAALFSLFGDTQELIGVTLTDSFLMLPMKSISGVLFASETSYRSCQLCPRDICPNRQAPYDSANWEKYQQA